MPRKLPQPELPLLAQRPVSLKRRPKPEGAPTWFAVFGAQGAPAPGERGYVPPGSLRPRIVNVVPATAIEFVAQVHRTLPVANYRGLLYSIGVEWEGRLVAVALANTPAGHHAAPDGVVELSRVASDKSLRGASSMLAARVMDLLPRSGRFGTVGTLFLTYSLEGEPGMTYLALVDKGLRPTKRVYGQAPSGQRQKAEETALPRVRKIAWEAGPAAGPPRWDLLRGVVDPKILAQKEIAFQDWVKRDAQYRADAARHAARRTVLPNPTHWLDAMDRYAACL